MSFEKLPQALQERRRAALYRQRQVLESPQQPELVINGAPCLAFCSNDYLGLANHPALIKAFQAAADKYGVGGGASHLVCGHSYHHHALEEELAAFTNRSRALLFSTGYMANLGAISALLGKQDAIFQDRLNHASLIDAGLSCGARFQRYLHNDATSLQQKLAKTTAERQLIVTDGVFSMDGDIADLPALSRAAAETGSWLMVDDAHGIGCLGATGAGSLEHFGLGQNDAQVLMGTLGKALGSAGAFIAGSSTLIETLVQQARTYIYTTSMPPAVAAAGRAGLQLIAQEPWRREKLAELITRFRTGCEQLGLPLMPSSTPIQPILVGDAAKALAMNAALREQGIYVTAIRPPTVPPGSARLRITLSAAHTEQQIDRLLEALATTNL